MVDVIGSFFKKDYQVFAFLIIGILLILFPKQLTALAPYIVGGALITYAVINIYISLRYADSEPSLGDAIVKGILGVIVLIQKEQSISLLGIIWAMQSFGEAAADIDVYRKKGKFHLLSFLSIVISIILAAILIADPFEHFAVHVAILGIEMIAYVILYSDEKQNRAR